MRANKKRTYGQMRADKERRLEESKGKFVLPPDHILDVRICFRASTALRDLSWRVHQELGISQGELYRSMLLDKAKELGVTPGGLSS